MVLCLVIHQSIFPCAFLTSFFLCFPVFCSPTPATPFLERPTLPSIAARPQPLFFTSDIPPPSLIQHDYLGRTYRTACTGMVFSSCYTVTAASQNKRNLDDGVHNLLRTTLLLAPPPPYHTADTQTRCCCTALTQESVLVLCATGATSPR